MGKRCAVTGGAGFIGAHLVRKLVRSGWDVVVVDNMIRGAESRFGEIAGDFWLSTCDIRDEAAVARSISECEVVFHLAAINGTENFYTQPELVLDIGVRGALSVVNACRSVDVPDLVVASSAEVYQTPPTIPTPEAVPLMLPDSLNPRYSYGGSKIITELIALNYYREHFRKVQVFRPHNVYGPDMGRKHVVPQFILRALECRDASTSNFPVQGTGQETRAFAYVDDVVDGIIRMYENGTHREVYHIGNDEEVSISDLAAQVGKAIGVELQLAQSQGSDGATQRRCPDISKMRSLGYEPQVTLTDGIARTVAWYEANRQRASSNNLM